MARGQLIAVYVPPTDPHNLLWSKEHRLPPAWRWTIRFDLGRGLKAMHPTLSRQMFRTYTQAVRAIEKIIWHT